MSDYLKMVSSILLIFLFISVAYAKMDKIAYIYNYYSQGHNVLDNIPRNVKPLSDIHCEEILKDIEQYIIENEWDFEKTTYDKEVVQITVILNKNGVTFDNYYVAIMKFLAIDRDGKKSYLLKVGVVIKGLEGTWIGKWALLQDSDVIQGDIKKIEGSRIPEKQKI